MSCYDEAEERERDLLDDDDEDDSPLKEDKWWED